MHRDPSHGEGINIQSIGSERVPRGQTPLYLGRPSWRKYQVGWGSILLHCSHHLLSICLSRPLEESSEAIPVLVGLANTVHLPSAGTQQFNSHAGGDAGELGSYTVVR